jgi:hypothetical protein
MSEQDIENIEPEQISSPYISSSPSPYVSSVSSISSPMLESDMTELSLPPSYSSRSPPPAYEDISKLSYSNNDDLSYRD